MKTPKPWNMMANKMRGNKIFLKTSISVTETFPHSKRTPTSMIVFRCQKKSARKGHLKCSNQGLSLRMPKINKFNRVVRRGCRILNRPRKRKPNWKIRRQDHRLTTDTIQMKNRARPEKPCPKWQRGLRFIRSLWRIKRNLKFNLRGAKRKSK